MTVCKYDRLKTLKAYDLGQNPTSMLPGGNKSLFPIPFLFLSGSVQSPRTSFPWSLLEATYWARGLAELSQHCRMLGNLNRMVHVQGPAGSPGSSRIKFCSVMQVEKKLLIILPSVLACLRNRLCGSWPCLSRMHELETLNAGGAEYTP